MGDWKVLLGDAWDIASSPTSLVQAVVTSPPYWRQRAYTESADEFGRKETIEDYAAKLGALFGSLRAWLKDDGCAWLNIGDSYSGGRLMGVPYRVAQAVEANGWAMRSEVIYERENLTPRPSVGRPMRSHEHLFLFSKGEAWFYDDGAMREPAKYAGYHYKRPNAKASTNGRLRMDKDHVVASTRTIRTVWRGPTGWNGKTDHPAVMPKLMAERCVMSVTRIGDTVLDPFCGSGTTGVVAIGYGRSFIGFELSEAYVADAKVRLGEITQQALI